MLCKEMEQALNDQIKWELWSGYMYLSMSAYFDDQGLSGFAQWMKNQAAEELFHATKFFDYVNEAGGRVKLQTVEEPPHEWESALDVFKEGLKHERKVTSMINDLVDLAIKHKDHATNNFLQWFVGEQVEEEASFDELVGKLKLVGDGGALYMLDKELGARVFTWPAEKE
ncbi:ferritin [Desulfohalovibrio reitneri]|uniref:ferritin n=1 Tax=Desulfohalovibrio reitneri TaxID=1307759 RepID=UPI0004A6B972|nr:ferritin [Desulfohalovibrio reitneri]